MTPQPNLQFLKHRSVVLHLKAATYAPVKACREREVLRLDSPRRSRRNLQIVSDSIDIPCLRDPGVDTEPLEITVRSLPMSPRNLIKSSSWESESAYLLVHILRTLASIFANPVHWLQCKLDAQSTEMRRQPKYGKT
jgi:hypothetical protein